MRVVDISKPLRAGEEMTCEIPRELPVYEGHPCEEYRFSFRSHVGSYYETSAHLFRGATMTCDVPAERLLMPTVIARLSPGNDGAIEPGEVAAATRGEIGKGDGLIVDTRGREARYFSRSFGAWAAERGVALLAASLERYDTGFVNPTGVFVELFKAEIPILAGVQNLEEIAHERVFLVVLPLRMERVCAAPCRAVVLDGEADEVEWLVAHLRPEG